METPRHRDRSLGDGVYFAAHDYIGVTRRIFILLIDSLALFIIFYLLALAWISLVGEPGRMFTVILVIAVWIYSVPLKRSKIRTMGYRLAGARLVTLKGHRPSLLMLTFRSVLWMLGPFNLGFDMIWCSVDDERQTLCDRFASICLVKSNAQPIGTGEVHLVYYNALGWTFAYPYVVHPNPATP